MVPGTASSASLKLEFRLRPHAGIVSVVRRFVEERCAKLGGDPGSVSRVTMATHELLENAAKYSVGEYVHLKVEFNASCDSIRTQLTNETTPVHRARLRERIRLLQNAQESFDLYQTLMRRSFEAGEESGLGLARICSEGELALAMGESENTVTFVAHSHPPRNSQDG